MKKLSIILVLGSFYTLCARDAVSEQSQASYASNLAKTGAQFTAEMLAYAQRNSTSDEEFTKLVSSYFQELAIKASELLPPATMSSTVKSLTDSLVAKVQETLINSLTGHQTSLEAPSDTTQEPKKIPVSSSIAVSAPPAAPAPEIAPTTTTSPTEEPFSFKRESTESNDDESAGLHDDMSQENHESSALHEPSTTPMPLDQVKVQSISSAPTIEIYENQKGVKAAKGAALGTYHVKEKTAKMADGTFYTDVIEYKASVTPPSTDGKHVAFAQIPNPNYTEGNPKLMGGAFKMITLYGIPSKAAATSSRTTDEFGRIPNVPVPTMQKSTKLTSATITPGMKVAATAKLMQKQPSATPVMKSNKIPAMPSFAPGIQMPQSAPATTAAAAA